MIPPVIILLIFVQDAVDPLDGVEIDLVGGVQRVTTAATTPRRSGASQFTRSSPRARCRTWTRCPRNHHHLRHFRPRRPSAPRPAAGIRRCRPHYQSLRTVPHVDHPATTPHTFFSVLGGSMMASSIFSSVLLGMPLLVDHLVEQEVDCGEITSY